MEVGQKKTRLIVAVIILMIICIFGIRVYEEQKNEQNVMEEVLGYVEHGAVAPNISDNMTLLPFEYNEGQFSIDYYLHANGIAEDIGLMVFLDGKIVQSSVDGGEYQYCNYFELDGSEQNFTFSLGFSTEDLDDGKEYSLDIVSIYYPSYEPDMMKDESYGICHSALASNYSIICQTKETDYAEISNSQASISSVCSYKPISDIELNDFGIDEIANENFTTEGVYFASYIDEMLVYDNYNILEDQIHITHEFFGKPGVEYETTFFIDHEPIKVNSEMSVQHVTRENQVCVIDFYLDAEIVEDRSKFYSITVPKKTFEYLEHDIGIYKTNSVLLYK